MEYKYAGKSFDIVWNDDGKFECTELNITKDTPDEVKTEIRAQTKKESKLPRVPVLIFNRFSDEKVVEGFSTLKNVSSYRSSKYVWVTFKNKRGKSEREKKMADEVFKDTLENRAKIAQIIEKREQANVLENDARDIRESLERVEAIDL